MLDATNAVLEIVSKFIAIVATIISIVEALYRIRKYRTDESPRVWNSQSIAELALKWIFLVLTTLGLPTVMLAVFGVYLTDSHRGNINDAFVYSIGYVTGLVMLYGVFWGSVIRTWLGKLVDESVTTR